MRRLHSFWQRFWTPSTNVRIRKIETTLGLKIRQLALYEQALRHPSFERHIEGNLLHSYERLEFLGDAVLSCVVAEHLYRTFPAEMEGFLTTLRSKLVSRKACARVATALDLGTLVYLSPELESKGGRHNASILADCLESLSGAIYLDRGMPAAKAFIQEYMISGIDLSQLSKMEYNHKSLLLEYAQARGWGQPVYEVSAVDGPPHNREFTIVAFVRKKQYGRAKASSKKRAEQMAARQALSQLRSEA